MPSLGPRRNSQNVAVQKINQFAYPNAYLWVQNWIFDVEFPQKFLKLYNLSFSEKISYTEFQNPKNLGI